MADRRLTYSRIGGDPVLDLLNTVKWRRDPQRAVDDLPDYRAALRWARQCDIISDAETAQLQRQAAAEPSSQVDEQHTRLLTLRETIYAGLVDRSPEAVSRLTEEYVDSLRHARLLPHGATWVWAERSLALRTLRDRMIRQAVALITSPAIGQLNQCEDSGCGWVFIDTSHGRNRRWCSASDCGNRNRNRRYYVRHRDPRGFVGLDGVRRGSNDRTRHRDVKAHILALQASQHRSCWTSWRARRLVDRAGRLARSAVRKGR